MSGRQIPISEIIELLLPAPIDDRDTTVSRKLFDSLDFIECVWSGRTITGKYEVDHVIPFTLWHNNDVWNLLPAAPKINNSKRDRLPEKQLLEKRRDIIIHYWQIINKNMPERFCLESGRFTGRCTGNNWETVLFSTLVDAVEFTSLQRGVERWNI